MEQIIELPTHLPLGWFERLEELVSEDEDLQDVELHTLTPPGAAGGGLTRGLRVVAKSAKKLAHVIALCLALYGAATSVTVIDTASATEIVYTGPLPDINFKELTVTLEKLHGKEIKIRIGRAASQASQGD
jgi:hypothetical protein